MPRVFLVAVCADSAIDQRSNNVSLFNLIEALQIAELPQRIPVEVHVYAEFDEAERGQPHELRFGLEDEHGSVTWRSQIMPVTSDTRRMRIIGQGLNLSAPGSYHLLAEMRPAGEESTTWIRASVAWPLEVSLVAGQRTAPGEIPA